MDDMKFQATSPKLESSETSLALLFTTFLNLINIVVTTRHKVQQLYKQVKLSVGNQVGKITRELDKESLLN